MTAAPLLAPNRKPRTLTVVLPLPPRELSSNARVHWAQKARATAAYRELAFWTACQTMGRTYGPPMQRASLSVVIEIGARTRHDGLYAAKDPSNALHSLKAAIDGVVAAEAIVDDAAQYLVSVSASIRQGCPESRVLLTLTELVGEGTSAPPPEPRTATVSSYRQRRKP